MVGFVGSIVLLVAPVVQEEGPLVKTTTVPNAPEPQE